MRIRRLSAIAGTALAAGSLAVGAGLAQGRVAHKFKVGPPTSIENTHGTSYFSIVRTANGIEYTAGIIQDHALGTGAITYDLAVHGGNAGTIDATAHKVTLYTKTGSLSGTATAVIKAANTNEQTVSGRLNLDHGAGSLKGDSLTATFTGTADLAKNLIQFKYRGHLEM
ncbi:MAG: hypothetical protein ACRDMJ_04975 [Solirubrobacteraceae bacterium]